METRGRKPNEDTDRAIELTAYLRKNKKLLNISGIEAASKGLSDGVLRRVLASDDAVLPDSYYESVAAVIKQLNFEPKQSRFIYKDGFVLDNKSGIIAKVEQEGKGGKFKLINTSTTSLSIKAVTGVLNRMADWYYYTQVKKN